MELPSLVDATVPFELDPSVAFHAVNEAKRNSGSVIDPPLIVELTSSNTEFKDVTLKSTNFVPLICVNSNSIVLSSEFRIGSI